MVINQFHSIGDILFIEPICKKLWIKNNEKPYLPVRDHLMWLAEYIDSAQFVPMSQFKLDYDSLETDKQDYLPLRFANQIIRNLAADNHSDYSNMMHDKYRLAKMDPDDWQGLDLKFNPAKGKSLFEKLGLKFGDNYILINENCQAGKVAINVEAEKVIHMREIPGFTLIDWYMVILNAKENHHVSTSTFYLMQAIANKFDFKSQVFLYPRPNEDGLQGIAMLETSFEYTKCE